ncbi:MAG: glycosyltransferase family 39 protein [Alphaproteobacteria bacterium]|nr:glycosyltransferase family 39 protein [Alphaproteobacteria bacterium]
MGHAASARPGFGPDGPIYDRLAWAVLGLVALAIALNFRDYGISWDEPVQNTYGKLSLNYYLTLGGDRSSFTYVNLYWYGALFDTLAAAANRISPFGEFDTRHLLNALVGVVGLAATWRLGRRLGGPRVGFVALLLLALTPVWYGNGFINPKDIPFAAAMTWASVFLVRIARNLPQGRWRDFLGFGLAAGAAMGTRVGGAIALAYLAATLAMYAVLALMDRRGVAAVVRSATALVAPGIGAAAAALGVMYLFWPWAQHRPIAGPLESFESFSRFPITFDYPFYGRIVSSIAVPWYYEPGMMAVMLPELMIAGSLAAGALGLAGLVLRGPGRWARALPFLVLALTAIFPPAYVALERAVLFDGMRHLLFVVPALGVAAALALDRLWRKGQAGSAAVIALLAATTVNQAVLLYRSHPYQYLVFNAFTGGVPGAAGKFELDYWGLAFRAAAEALAERAPPPGARPWRVVVCGPETSASLFFPPGFVLWSRQRVVEADFYISNTRYQCPLGTYVTTAPEMAAVSRFGTKLAHVYDLRGHNALTYMANPAAP